MAKRHAAILAADHDLTARAFKMHIFLDESGTFRGDVAKKVAPSAVGALVVPSQSFEGFQKLFGRLRRHLPQEGGEVKGRLLTEANVATVVDVLKKVGCLFEATVVDLGMHSEEDLRSHKLGQEEALTAHLTPEHQPGLIEDVWNLRRQLERTPLQLYVQSVVLNEVVYNVLNHADNYFALRNPKELAEYHWVLDAKDRDKKTKWEEWWETTVLAMVQSKTMRKPFIKAEGGDFSHHERFKVELPEYLRSHASDPEKGEFFDMKSMMRESFRFSSSIEFGLEAVDVLTNAVRRSLAGNFRRPGWIRIRELMIHRRERHYVGLVYLGLGEPDPNLPYQPVLKDFTSGGRSLLPPSYRALMTSADED